MLKENLIRGIWVMMRVGLGMQPLSTRKPRFLNITPRNDLKVKGLKGTLGTALPRENGAFFLR